MSGSVTIQGLLSGTTSGTQYVGPLTITANTSGNYESIPVALSTGSNTITVPSWAVFCIIIPSTTNTQALTFGGLSLSLTSPNLFSLNGSSGSFALTSAGATTVTVVFS
jgi:hypothetical protein